MRIAKGKRVFTVAAIAAVSAAIALCQAPTPAPSGDQSATPAAQAPAATPAAPAAPAGPTALPTPSVTGPISMLPPANVGKIQLNAIADFMGMATTNHAPGDHTTDASVTNGMVWIQKTDGVFQFYVQAGVYDIPSMGTPFLQLDKTSERSLRSGACGLCETAGGERTPRSRSVLCPP